MYKYQNVSEETQSITRNGNITPRIVKAGATVLTDVPIENPNFKYLGEEQTGTANINAITVTQENAVTQAEPINTNKEETI